MGLGFLALLDGLAQLAWLLVWWIAILALLILGLVALVTALVMSWFSPRRSNCFAYVVNRWRKDGGYVVLRWSKRGPWLHFLWTDDFEHFWAYNPPTKAAHASPPINFTGHEAMITSPDQDDPMTDAEHVTADRYLDWALVTAGGWMTAGLAVAWGLWRW